MKLTETMKKEILERVKAGELYKEIAKDFDVHPNVISQLALKNGYRARGGEKTGKICPKCHRGGVTHRLYLLPLLRGRYSFREGDCDRLAGASDRIAEASLCRDRIQDQLRYAKGAGLREAHGCMT